MNVKLGKIAERCLAGEKIDRDEIDVVLAQSRSNLFDVLYWANKIRERFFGNRVKVCGIVPGRFGGCDQDCKFCAQSARYDAGRIKTRTLSDEEMLKAAEQAKLNGVRSFGIVYSGRTAGDEEIDRLCGVIRQIRERFGLRVCAGLGLISGEQAKRLARAGLTGYNHNLETSERHFGDIVTTHTYGDRVKTIEAAQAAGLRVCAGGIFGIGEMEDDRVDMALELRRLGVDTVPMNFLHPIEGTPMGIMKTPAPMEALRIVAVYRFILPQTTLKIAGGRILNLRDLQSWMFYAGANSMMIGNYLATAGRAVEQDMQMLKDLALEVDVD
jgi:biotin synthase